VALAAATAAALGVVAFWPALNHDFVFDDYAFIVSNPAVTRPGPWYRFWRLPYWPRELSPDKLYRPLTSWSLRANLVLSGEAEAVAAGKATPSPRPIHLTNLVLHALTSAGVAWLAWRLTHRAWPAWLAGALFAVHPIHTEAVVTGYGRSELLAGLFAVWLLARYLHPWADTGFSVRGSAAGSKGPAASGGTQQAARCEEWESGVEGAAGLGPRGDHVEEDTVDPRSTIPNPKSTLWFHLLNPLIFLAGVMSKEHVLFVWPVLLVYDLWRYRQLPAPRRPMLREWLDKVAAPAHAGFMLAISAFFFLRFSVFGWQFRLDATRVRFWESPVAHATLTEHVLTPFRLLWLTLKLLVWPPSLCPIWSIPALSLPRGPDADVLAGMILLSAVLIASRMLWRRSPMGVVLIGSLFLLAIPIQVLPMAHWIYAERWLYLATVLPAVLIAAALARLGRWGCTLGLAAAIVLLPASWQYGGAYRDFKTMLTEVVRRQPENFQGWKLLANLYCHVGEHREAIHAAREAIERFSNVGPRPPDDPYLVLAISHIALGEGRPALEALDRYEWLRREIPGPMNIDGYRRQAEALIAAEAARSRPATRPEAG